MTEKMDIDQMGQTYPTPSTSLAFDSKRFTIEQDKPNKLPASQSDMESTTWDMIKDWTRSQLEAADEVPVLDKPAPADSWYNSKVTARRDAIDGLTYAYQRQLDAVNRMIGPDHSKPYPVFVQWWHVYRSQHVAGLADQLVTCRNGWVLFVTERDRLLQLVDEKKATKQTLVLPERDCWSPGWDNPLIGVEVLRPKEPVGRRAMEPLARVRSIPSDISETPLRMGANRANLQWVTGASRWLMEWCEGVTHGGSDKINPGWTYALRRSAQQKWRLELSFE